MTWLALKHYRGQFLIALALLAAMAMFVVPTGLQNLGEFHAGGLSACVARDQPCPELRRGLTQEYTTLSSIVVFFNLVPAVLGVLLAAPIVAELDNRTFRLAWTQSISRERWLLTKLGVALACTAVLSLLFTLMMTWWYSPFDHAALLGHNVGPSFDFEGVMPFVYTLFSFSLALLTGVWTRSTLAAALLTITGFIVGFLGVLSVREQGAVPAPSNRLIEAGAVPVRNMAHFWTVQTTEAAIFVAAAVVLTGLAMAMVGRRA